jgi:hypothetical protein
LGHANSAARRDNTRPVFGFTDRDSGRAFGCSKGQSRAEQPGLAAVPFLADGPDRSTEAVGWLDDVEIDALLAAVTTEAERCGRRPPGPAKEKPAADAKPQRRQEAAEDSLTTGKLNAVRAAFKAGVKPSAIARQFGISQSDVRKASVTNAGGLALPVISRACRTIGGSDLGRVN